MDVLVSSIRGMLIASPGHELYCADFAAVEARVAFWIADHEEGMQAFRENRKLYEEMASEAFGIPIEKVTKESLERFVGKESVLGCLAEGTPVLTQNGFKSIEKITLKDWLWDGEKWVRHRGLLRKGLKPVIRIEIENLEMTPDHRILTSAGWQTAVEIASDAHIPRRKLELSIRERQLCRRNLNGELSAVSLCAAYAELKKNFELIISGKEETLSVCPALKKYISPTVETLETAISCLIQDLSHVGKLVSTISGVDVSTLIRKTGNGMEVAAFNAVSNHIEDFWNTLLLCAGLTNPVSTWTELIMTGTMSPETYESLVPELTSGIKETYDIYKSGNKFCYQAGHRIVSNCQYGLGWNKFLKNCHMKGVPQVTPEMAKKAVYTYRKIHHPIPEFWAAIEQACIQAVLNPGKQYRVTKVMAYVSDRWLNIKLPSGRRLRYFNPRITQKQLASGKMVPEIRYWAMEFHQWKETSIWGGIFTNHIVQGTSRDLMVNAAFNIENAGYKFLLSVHDEALAERKKGQGDVEEFVGLMTKLPKWAEGAPITAEGWSGPRYRK
jgi:hypothetical protein